MSDTSDTNPCLACGACCMSYRVSFYWAEAEQRGLPSSLTEQLNPYLACMAGTNARAMGSACRHGLPAASLLR